MQKNAIERRERGVDGEINREVRQSALALHTAQQIFPSIPLLPLLNISVIPVMTRIVKITIDIFLPG